MDGMLGNISIAPESTYGTDPATGYVDQFGIGSTLGLRRSRVRPIRLGRGIVGVSADRAGFIEGEITLAMTNKESIIGDILGLFGNINTSVFSLANDAPDVTSVSVRVNHGMDSNGDYLEYVYTGCRGTSLRFDLPENGPPQMVIGLIGRSMAKVASPSTVSMPVESNLYLQSDFDALQVASSPYAHKGVTISLDAPHSGADRSFCGATWIRKPVPSSQMALTGSFVTELDQDSAEANYDTAAIIDLYIAGTTLGAITIGTTDFVLSGCEMVGDPPSLGMGAQDFTVNFESNGLAMTLA